MKKLSLIAAAAILAAGLSASEPAKAAPVQTSPTTVNHEFKIKKHVLTLKRRHKRVVHA